MRGKSPDALGSIPRTLESPSNRGRNASACDIVSELGGRAGQRCGSRQCRRTYRYNGFRHVPCLGAELAGRSDLTVAADRSLPQECFSAGHIVRAAPEPGLCKRSGVKLCSKRARPREVLSFNETRLTDSSRDPDLSHHREQTVAEAQTRLPHRYAKQSIIYGCLNPRIELLDGLIGIHRT